MTDTRFDVERAGALPYLIARPRLPVTPAALQPVLCFLHGYDEGAPAEIQHALTRHGPLRTGAAQAAAAFLVVAPQLPLRGDLWRRYAGAVQDIVETVQQREGGDPHRTYLTGFSYGANGVFDLAVLQATFWAALWAVDPTRVPPVGPQQPVWVSFGTVARMRKPTFLRTLQLISSPAYADEKRVYTDNGADHVGAATEAYADERIYHWLLAQRL
jgi:predicted peptidase